MTEKTAKALIVTDPMLVKAISVDQGPMSRRFLARAMGRATRVNKKSSHVHVVLTDGAK